MPYFRRSGRRQYVLSRQWEFFHRLYQYADRLMVASPLAEGLSNSASITSFPTICVLRQIHGLVPESDGKLSSGKKQTCSSEEGIPQAELQEILWQEFFSDLTQWWDDRRSKPTPRNADFRHKKTNAALWLDNRHKPAWVDSELATRDSGKMWPTTVEERGASAGYEDYLNVELLKKLCEDGRVSDAVDILDHVVQRGCYVPSKLFYGVLKRCKDLVLGRRVHALSMQSGYEGDAFLATHLIGFYASHGMLDAAMQVFSKVSTADAYNWATIISAYARHGKAAQAIRLYRQMLKSSVKPDSRIYSAVLRACATVRDLVAGKEVHAHYLSRPGRPDIVVQTGLIDMYAKCGSLEDARRVFDRLPDKDVVTWNAMIAGYSQQGMGHDALTLHSRMQEEGIAPTHVTFVCLLQACASMGLVALDQGKQLHEQIEKRGMQHDVVLGTCLIDMYAKCSSTEDARRVFDRLPERNVVTWNAMISGYALQGMRQEAVALYNRMQQEHNTNRMRQEHNTPNSVTFLCLLQACASAGAEGLHQGKELHEQIEERGLQDDVVLAGSLVNMYSKCGSTEDARKVFDILPVKDVVTWTTMIAGYAQQGMGQEALLLYSSMQQDAITPNSVTFMCLLQACAIVGALPLGKQLHAQIEERGLQADLGLGIALINMYAKCGSMFDGQQVFDSLPERTCEAWGALIAGYSRQGDSEVVFHLLEMMRLEGIQPNAITFLGVLTACSHAGLVDKGRKYFDALKADYGICPTIEHYIGMMDLLGRAGHLDEALLLAKTMPFPPDAAVWRTLLGACQKWNNVEIGQQAFEFAVSVDAKDATSYVLMSNIYGSTQMREKAKEMQARRLKSGAWKEPGQSWCTDMDGVVHKFLVVDKKPP